MPNCVCLVCVCLVCSSVSISWRGERCIVACIVNSSVAAIGIIIYLNGRGFERNRVKLLFYTCFEALLGVHFYTVQRVHTAWLMRRLLAA